MTFNKGGWCLRERRKDLGYNVSLQLVLPQLTIKNMICMRQRLRPMSNVL